MSGLFCGTDAADDLRVGQRVQRRLSLGGRKGAVSQQAAVEGAVCPYNIRPEALRQLGQQRRAGKQDLAGELVGVCQRDAPGRKTAVTVDLPQPLRPVMPSVIIARSPGTRPHE